MIENELKKIINSIPHSNPKYQAAIMERWNHLAKPIGGLGRLEEMVGKLGSIYHTMHPKVDKRAIVIMAGDHGVVEEGVTQTGSEVTRSVMENMTVTASSITPFAEVAHADLIPVDVGVAADLYAQGIWKRKVRYGTGNIRREPAMTREEAAKAILTGIQVIGELKKQGYEAAAIGEMGIGNTTISSAICAYLLEVPVEEVTGKGAGLTSQALKNKIQVIKDSLKLHQPDRKDMLDVISKIGGLEVAGMAGCYLGGAYHQMPVVIDGFISSVAAYIAVQMAPAVREYLFASHCSDEPAGKKMLKALSLDPYFYGNMRLGEGTGAAMCFTFMDYALAAYEGIPSFDEADIEDYVPLD